METIEKIKARFEEIRTQRPNTNFGFVHKVLGWACRLLGWLFFITGAGLLIATAMSHSLFQLANDDNRISSLREAYEQIVLILQGIIGTGTLFTGIVLLTIAALCRYIIKRNKYILDLEELLETN